MLEGGKPKSDFDDKEGVATSQGITFYSEQNKEMFIVSTFSLKIYIFSFYI